MKAKRIAKVLLALVTLGAIEELFGFGAYAAPVLVPFLWLAAWDSGSVMKLFWSALALPCGWVVGWRVDNPEFFSEHAVYSEEPPEVAIAHVAALITLALFMIPMRYGRRTVQ